MKTINKTSLLLAIVILAVAFSIYHVAAPAEIRYSWHGLKPVELLFRLFHLCSNDSLKWTIGLSIPYPC